jgi:nitroreductase
LKPGNQAWCKNVPVLMLSCAGSVFSANGNPNRWAQHDTGMASLSIALQAVALGLIVHQIGGFDPDKARTAFNIPDEYTPMAMIAVGYQAEPEVLDAETLKKEMAPRKRRPLVESFFEGNWGTPVKS